MKKIILLLSTVILVFLAACDVDVTENLPKAENQDEAETQGDTGPVIEPQEPSESPDDTVVNPRNDQDNDDVIVTDPDADDYIGFSDITKQQCTEASGHWNTCGSPCAGTGADFCIEMCQVQCECGGIAGFNCPEGFKCRLSGKIRDEMGVCVQD